MSIEDKVTSLIEGALENLGYELIRVKQIGKDILQIMIDSANKANVEDCAKASRLISRILQVAEINDYALEVSSPGIDRPLTKPEHFLKYIGSNIKLSTFVPIDGQKKFSGKLINFDKNTKEVEMDCAKKIIKIDFEKVQSANLQIEINKIKK